MLADISNSDTHLYADDLSMYMIGKNVSEIQQNLQNDILIIFRFGVGKIICHFIRINPKLSL